MKKIEVVFTNAANSGSLPGGHDGYWVHHRQQGRRSSITIYIDGRLGRKRRVAVLVHELTEALATNLTDSRKFDTSHHDIANELETLVERLLEVRISKKLG